MANFNYSQNNEKIEKSDKEWKNKLDNLIGSKKGLDGIIKESGKLAQGFKSIGKSNYVAGALYNASLGQILGPLETNQGFTIKCY